MVNIKDNIWIEGFDTIEEMSNKLSHLIIIDNIMSELIYSGKTSEIPEELAKECVVSLNNTCIYVNYKLSTRLVGYFNDVIKSIQSACDQEYCIIFKKNNNS
jgi:hypothetical protein